MFHSPCKDCPDRYLGCHSKCEKYIEFQRKNEELKSKRFSDSQRERDYYETFKRHRKGRTR